jgi:hypothetical protein
MPLTQDGQPTSPLDHAHQDDNDPPSAVHRHLDWP